MKQLFHNLKKYRDSLIIISLFVIFFAVFLMNIYMFVFKDTGESYSTTREWKQYYSLEDWNYPLNAEVDMNEDGKKDAINFIGCAFVSGVNPTAIPEENHCTKVPTVINGISPDQLGQQLSEYRGVVKSFLVETYQSKWKHYSFYFTGITVFELQENGLFKEVAPNLLDYVDWAFYFVSQVLILLFILLKIV